MLIIGRLVPRRWWAGIFTAIFCLVNALAGCAPDPQASDAVTKTSRVLKPTFDPEGEARFDDASKMAFVIGNSDYRHIASLVAPPNDARLISRAFKKIGIQTETRTDLSLGAFASQIQDFLSRSAQADVDVAIIYYAGHAIQIDGQNYLVPVDYRSPDVPTLSDSLAGLISVSGIVRAIEGAGIRKAIIVLDACRDNPFKSARYGVLAREGSTGLARPSGRVEDAAGTLPHPSEIFFLYSAEPGRRAVDSLEDDPLHSPFARSLTRWIVDADRTFEEVVRATVREVQSMTLGGQVPWSSNNLSQPVRLAPRLESPIRIDTARLTELAGEGDLVLAKSIRHLIDSHKEESRRESEWSRERDLRYVAVSESGAHISVNICHLSRKICTDPKVAERVVARCEEQSGEDCGLLAVIENGAMATLWKGRVRTGAGVRARAEAIIIDLNWSDVGPVRGRVDYAARGLGELTLTMERTGTECAGIYKFDQSRDAGTFNGTCKDGTKFTGKFVRNSAWSFEAWGTDSRERAFNGVFSLERRI